MIKARGIVDVSHELYSQSTTVNAFLCQFTRAKTIAAVSVTCCLGMLVTLWGQSTATTLRGTWAATVVAPSQTLQGTWTAQLDGAEANTASGTWTLLDRSNRTAAQGTWSAIKSASNWSGSWQARIAGNNRLLSGTWRTQPSTSDVKTFRDLLQHTLREQVSGAWVSGALRGAWSLRSFE